MALQGTIEDFALPDIFQLIGIQRKTGVLTLSHEQDSVTIKFLEGQVVEADTASDSLENRLGTVLVRTGRIAEAQLTEALEIQRNTLQRLGHILVKRDYVSQEELVDALRIQSLQIIYRLFRWREGEYHFDAVEQLDYDETHSTPVSSESILMEGARMVDEWPIIERRIPSDKIVMRKTAAAEEIDPTETGEQRDAGAPADEDFDLGVELDLEPQPEEEQEEQVEPAPEVQIKLSPEERQVLELVDGERTVREIIDLLALPEFETFRALSEMLTRSLIEKVDTAKEAGQVARSGRVVPVVAGLLARTALVVGVVAAVGSLALNPATPWRLIQAAPMTEQLRLYAAMARLEQVERAVQVFYLDAGAFPRNLGALVEYGYLDPSALTDPWGRPFEFYLSSGGYQLLAQDAAGEPRPELTVSRGFSEVQRLMVGSGAPQGP